MAKSYRVPEAGGRGRSSHLFRRSRGGALGVAGAGLLRRGLGEDLLGQVEVRRSFDGLGVGAPLLHASALDALEREREPTALAVDLDDLRADEVALRDDLARVFDVVLRELGDVHEALDARHDLD